MNFILLQLFVTCTYTCWRIQTYIPFIKFVHYKLTEIDTLYIEKNIYMKQMSLNTFEQLSTSSSSSSKY